MDRLLDRSAASLSALCVAHCLAGALAVAAAMPLEPLLGHGVHVIGLMVAVPLALFALIRGWLCHGRPLAVALGGAGLALLAAGIAVPHGDGREFALSAAGAGLLAAAHRLNLRWSRSPA